MYQLNFFSLPNKQAWLATALVSLLISNVQANVEIAKSEQIQSCQALSRIEGSSGYGKHPNWQIPAKHHALQQAEQLGATHVVWERTMPITGFNGIIVAQAYQCGALAAK